MSSDKMRALMQTHPAFGRQMWETVHPEMGHGRVHFTYWVKRGKGTLWFFPDTIANGVRSTGCTVEFDEDNNVPMEAHRSLGLDPDAYPLAGGDVPKGFGVMQHAQFILEWGEGDEFDGKCTTTPDTPVIGQPLAINGMCLHVGTSTTFPLTLNAIYQEPWDFREMERSFWARWQGCSLYTIDSWHLANEKRRVEKQTPWVADLSAFDVESDAAESSVGDGGADSSWSSIPV
jgi:hypothetical protein